MKSDDIFRTSVDVMKRVLGDGEVTAAIMRARKRNGEANIDMLDAYRKQINDLVREIVGAEDPDNVLQGTTAELKDALVLRYLRNREIFKRTFPDGIDGIDPDPAAIWEAIMISPLDEADRSR
ncbi:MAG TPA: hypothetical protein VEP69_01220 [Thermodesulfovibrionales bacterium]|nr:hypothetical protein [Thermodesulfovibrionales bacterium]